MHITSMIVVFFGICLTGMQVGLTFIGKQALCFNQGCEVVDSLTTIPTLYFNVMGCCFFLCVFYALLKSKRSPILWKSIAQILLLAGMASEGLLIAFQHFIAETFCSYCLTVGGVILLANICLGFAQSFCAVGVFSAVFLTFSTLQFSPAQSSVSGLYASLAGEEFGEKRSFYFSSTCPHCEKILGSLKEENVCAIDFNPVDTIPSPPLENMSLKENYNYFANRDFLKNLGISAVPVLVVKQRKNTRILQGEREIAEYFLENCQPQKKAAASASSEQKSTIISNGEVDFLLPNLEEDGECSVESDENC